MVLPRHIQAVLRFRNMPRFIGSVYSPMTTAPRITVPPAVIPSSTLATIRVGKFVEKCMSNKATMLGRSSRMYAIFLPYTSIRIVADKTPMMMDIAMPDAGTKIK